MCKVSGANVDLLRCYAYIWGFWGFFFVCLEYILPTFYSFHSNLCVRCVASIIFRQFHFSHLLFKFSHENTLFVALKSLITALCRNNWVFAHSFWYGKNSIVKTYGGRERMTHSARRMIHAVSKAQEQTVNNIYYGMFVRCTWRHATTTATEATTQCAN